MKTSIYGSRMLRKPATLVCKEHAHSQPLSRSLIGMSVAYTRAAYTDIARIYVACCKSELKD
jgi:hypothetical protein